MIPSKLNITHTYIIYTSLYINLNTCVYLLCQGTDLDNPETALQKPWILDFCNIS